VGVVRSDDRGLPQHRSHAGGLLVLVVGPSAVGKDAIIGELRRSFAKDRRFLFARRIVTREENAAEDHLCVTPDTFQALLRQGALAFNWEAHGFQYGVAAEIDLVIRDGGTVVVNASRSQIPLARMRYLNTAVVRIDAPIALRLERLRLRQRERAEEIAARLERVASSNAVDADLVICNDGPLQHAVEIFQRWLQRRGEETAMISSRPPPA
jgi:ribose 1,5-bisphosphokinase